jgi:coenzyme F420 hydrogenase subunit beta
MRYALTLVCGGASDLRKSEDVLKRFKVEERELTLFRYRGNGNPGPTRLETKGGRVFELTYPELWEDESKWMLQPRCNICPDAIGLGVDIAASDTWPGGSPTGEDEGFNGIIVRTERGLELYEAAAAAGALTIIRDASFGDFDEFQPHQVRKRRAVWARLKGINAARRPVPVLRDLQVDECARLNSLRENLAEYRGARDRVKRGRLGEPKPMERGGTRATDS